MTSHNDLMPTQKLEWVTPKISLMEAGDTEGNKGFVKAGEGAVCAANSCRYSPS